MRRQLILVFVAVSTMVALAFVVPLAFLVQRTAEDRAIDAARADAAAIVPVLASGGSVNAVELAVQATTSGKLGQMTVVRADGTTIGSADIWSQRLAAAIATGMSAIGPTDDGQEIVVAVATGPGELSAVRVVVPEEELRRGRDRAWLALVVVGVVLVAMSVAVADRLARTIVRPTQNLASAALQLGGGDLDVRVEPVGPPELVELSSAFNALGSRISGMLVHERELVAELSHRLRTPLTRIRLRIEQVSDRAVAAELSEDVDELTRVVTGLIEDARGSAAPASAPCDLAEAVRGRVDFWAVLAEDQGRPWTVATVDGPLLVSVSRSDLEAAFDVLLENVFRHTDDDAAVEIGTEAADGFARVWVGDSGPGFNARQVARGLSGAGSTGLGLDIARRTTESIGGSFHIDSSHLGGSHVEMRFPLC